MLCATSGYGFFWTTFRNIERPVDWAGSGILLWEKAPCPTQVRDPGDSPSPPCRPQESVTDPLDGFTCMHGKLVLKIVQICTNIAINKYIYIRIHWYTLPTFNLGPPSRSRTASTSDCSTRPTKKLRTVNLNRRYGCKVKSVGNCSNLK